MPDQMEQSVVIKKYKKKGEEGHGGSWKVAYADFITSMMAVFLLLWLLTMTSQQKKIALSQYFQNHSIFEKGGGSAVGQHIDVPGQGVLDANSIPTPLSPRTITARDIASRLKEKFEEKTKNFSDRVFIINDNGNLRIEITDTGSSSFFNVGGTELNESGKALLKEIAPLFIGLDNKIIIEGHSDSLGYKGNVYTNWELSTQRASSARIELEKNGVKSNQVEMVAGYADTRPLDAKNPSNPKNRRISIVIDYSTKKNQAPPLPRHIRNEAPWIRDTSNPKSGP
ncbi:MAG TPA: OmpA family protein [Deltaproteobacteria bacterium]|nr:OmpA family protein [Deltaproteobacteria bacterium]HQI00190.1 OmpA family protein [Deltaproteobacteria bacterium]